MHAIAKRLFKGAWELWGLLWRSKVSPEREQKSSVLVVGPPGPQAPVTEGVLGFWSSYCPSFAKILTKNKRWLALQYT